MPAAATRPRTRPARTAPPAAPSPRELRLDAGDHLVWARAIARGVRADYGFRAGSEEELELEGCALVVLTKLVARFDEGRLPPGGDLGGAFRGYAARWVRGECRREAERLRNGGLYRTSGRAARPLARVEPLPVGADGGDAVADPRSVGADADEPDPPPRRKRRWNTRTGEEVADPKPPPLTYDPARPLVPLSRALVRLLVALDRLAGEPG